MSKWQPIETAPRDGTAIIGYDSSYWDGGDIGIIFWYKSDNNWLLVSTDYDDNYFNATHWMPLPDPPKG